MKKVFVKDIDAPPMERRDPLTPMRRSAADGQGEGEAKQIDRNAGCIASHARRLSGVEATWVAYSRSARLLLPTGAHSYLRGRMFLARLPSMPTERPSCACREFWQEKIETNRRRDQKVNRRLRSEGYAVLRIWEHAICDTRWLATLRTLLGTTSP